MWKRNKKGAPATAAAPPGAEVAADAKREKEDELSRAAAATKAQAEADKKHKEAQRQADEKHAAEVAAAEVKRRESAARESAEREAMTKAARADEDAKWRAQLAKMESSQLMTASLDKELASELEEVRTKLDSGRSAVSALEVEIVEVEASSVASREATAREIGELKEQLASYVELRTIVSAYETDASDLVSQAKEAQEDMEQRGADALGVAARMRKELDEAKVRLQSAEAQKHTLEKQMEKLVADAAPAEAAATEELDKLVSAAVAARLQSEMGGRLSDALVAEMARLLDAEGEVARHAAKVARVAEAKAEAERMRAQLITDASEERRLGTEQVRLEALLSRSETRETESAIEREAGIDRARRAAAAHGSFLDSARAQRGKVDPKVRPLVDSSLEAIGKAHDAALSEVAALETEHAALAAEHLKGDKARRDELRALAAQKAAVVTAKAEHERFLTETGRQVDALERAAAAAAQPIEGRTACIKMVQAELATARKEAERLEIAATAAEEKRLAHAKELELLKSRAKSRASALRVQVESESSIVDEQQRYVDSLAQRANVASEQTPSERELGVRLRVKNLVDGGAIEASERLQEVEAAKQGVSAALDTAGALLTSLEARAASQVATLREQLSATREAVVSLGAYESGLAELLAAGKVTVDKGGGGPLGALWTGVAGSRVSLLTSPDVITIALDESKTGGEAAGAKPPPDLEVLRREAGEAIEVIQHAASGQRSRPSLNKGRSLAENLTASVAEGILAPVDWIANTLSPRGVSVPPLSEGRASAEAETRAKTGAAEARAAEARAAAKVRSDAAEKQASAEAKARIDANQKAATARADATMAASGKSEVETWLDGKGLLACKTGLSGAGVRTLLDLANMEPTALRSATKDIDAPTRSKLMKAIDSIEL